MGMKKHTQEQYRHMVETETLHVDEEAWDHVRKVTGSYKVAVAEEWGKIVQYIIREEGEDVDATIKYIMSQGGRLLIHDVVEILRFAEWEYAPQMWEWWKEKRNTYY